MTSSACEGPVKTTNPFNKLKEISSSTISEIRFKVSGSIPFDTLIKNRWFRHYLIHIF